MPTERSSWYQRLFGGLFRGRSAAPTQETVLDRIKAIKAGRAASARSSAAIAEALRPVFPPAAETEIIDETHWDQPPAREADEEPEWETVSSSNIAAYCFWPQRGHLEVKFNDGSHYGYEGVPDGVMDAFRRAGSKGTFLKNSIEQVYWYYEISNKARKYRKYPGEYLGATNVPGGR